MSFIDEFFPVSKFIRQVPYVMVFKLTNYCWYNCAHCCENSGPDQPKNYIPLSAVKEYIAQAKKDQNFSNLVVFTGGEPMSAYRFFDKNYVPSLLDASLSENIKTDVKTNAAWVRTDLKQQIFSDLANVITKHKPYSLQVSLSLDDFHNNSLKNCLDFITVMAKDFDAKFIVHISSLYNQKDLFPDLLEGITKSTGNKILESFPEANSTKYYLISEKIILFQSNGVLFNGGRAKNMPEAKKTICPQFSFICGKNLLMAFDSFGKVTLGENSGRKIKTAWEKDKGIKSIEQIKKGLTKSCRYEELRIYLNMKNSFKSR